MKVPSPQPTWDDPLVEALRPELRDAIERVLETELGQALGAKRYQRVAERLGYRHGSEERGLGTPLSPVRVAVPRAGTRTRNRAVPLERRSAGIELETTSHSPPRCSSTLIVTALSLAFDSVTV